MRMTLRGIWSRLAATNYTRALEREVARLRAENRALLNSILGIAGVPPITVSADDLVAPRAAEFVAEKTAPVRETALETESGAEKRGAGRSATGLGVKQAGQRASAERGMKSVATPMRRS